MRALGQRRAAGAQQQLMGLGLGWAEPELKRDPLFKAFLSMCVGAEEGEGGVRARSASGALPGPSGSTPRGGAAGASASFVFWDVGDDEKKRRCCAAALVACAAMC